MTQTPVDRVHCLPLSEVVLYFVGELSPLPNPGLQFVVPPGTVDVRVLSCDIYNTKELIWKLCNSILSGRKQFRTMSLLFIQDTDFMNFFMMIIIIINYSREVRSVLSSTDTVLWIPVMCLLIRSIQCTSTCQRLSAIKSLLCNINDFLNGILKEEKHEKSSYPERIAIPRRRHVNPFGSSLRRTSNHWLGEGSILICIKR